MWAGDYCATELPHWRGCHIRAWSILGHGTKFRDSRGQDFICPLLLLIVLESYKVEVLRGLWPLLKKAH
jgi:hypothetical protein